MLPQRILSEDSSAAMQLAQLAQEQQQQQLEREQLRSIGRGLE